MARIPTFLTTVAEVIAQEEASIIPRTKSHRTTKETGPVSVVGYLRGRRAKELSGRETNDAYLPTRERANE